MSKNPQNLPRIHHVPCSLSYSNSVSSKYPAGTIEAWMFQTSFPAMFFSWSLSVSHLLSARLPNPSQTAKISHMSLRVQHRSSAWWMSFDSLSTLKGLYSNFKAIWSWNVTLLGFERILAYRVKYFIFVYSVLRRQGPKVYLHVHNMVSCKSFFKSILIV